MLVLVEGGTLYSFFICVVRLMVHEKCFYLVVDKEVHLYYYKNRKTNKCSRTNVYVCDKGS